MTEEKLKQALAILHREFPLMSSRRLRFMTAEMVVKIMNGELQECEGLHKAVDDYVKWMESGYAEELDPGREY